MLDDCMLCGRTVSITRNLLGCRNVCELCQEAEEIAAEEIMPLEAND